MKKINFALIFAVLSLNSIAFAQVFPTTFQDIELNSWYEDSVIKLQERGIIKGYEDNTFRPSNSVSRAELAVILDRFEIQINNQQTNPSFSDSKIENIVNQTLAATESNFEFSREVALANLGVKKLDKEPSGNLKLVGNLYDSYLIYEDSGIISLKYVNYVGQQRGVLSDTPDSLPSEDVWYGPF